MKMLRYLMAIALVCGLSGMAKADTIDFQAVVIDPQPAPGEVNLIFNQSFPVTLSTCHADQLDGLSTTDFIGCFTGLNLTGQKLTSLTTEFPAIFLPGNVLDQPSCPTETQNIFAVISCGFTDSSDTEYFLNFSGGKGIAAASTANGDCDNDADGGSKLNEDDITCDLPSIFTIAVGGIPAGDLPKSFTVTSNVPEPSSLLLMSTGVLSIGLFGAYRRRQFLCESRP
jgi:hypothetical protein